MFTTSSATMVVLIGAVVLISTTIGLLAGFQVRRRRRRAASSAAVASRGSASGLEASIRLADDSAVPVEEAVVTLTDTSGRQIARGVDAGDGRYLLEAEPGTYVLVVSKPGFRPSASIVEIAPVEEAVVADDAGNGASSDAGGGVDGAAATGQARVVPVEIMLAWDNRLGGTVRRVDGSPVGDAEVTLTDAEATVVAKQITGADGKYAFIGLAPGERTLTVTAKAFRPVTCHVEIPATGAVEHDVELVGGAHVQGTVRGVPAGDGPITAVPTARITLIDADGNVMAVTTADAHGRYRFSEVPAGDYTVCATAPPPVAMPLRVNGGLLYELDLELTFP